MSRIADRNKHFAKIVEQIIDEEGISETRVLHAIRHFFDWQRQSFGVPQYASYLWPYFGTFTWFNKKGKQPYFIEADIYRGYVSPDKLNTKHNTNGKQEETNNQ